MAMVSELHQAALEYLPLAFGIAACPIPPGWQGVATCQLLVNAENGIFSHPILRIGISEHAANREKLCTIIRDSKNGKISSGLQSKIYKCLVECIPDNWCSLLQRRLDALAGLSHIAQISGDGRDKLAKVLMTVGKPVAIHEVSRRRQEIVLRWMPLLSGCQRF